jgi:mono/diheme cytochrome c family protein
VLNRDESKALAWLAIEPADGPWPPIPGKDLSAGPFYIVWTGAEVASIRSEQWPYHMAKLVSEPSPVSRWPALAVSSALPATDPARAGQALFLVQCLPCHKLNRSGAADVGPDLNLPQNPTEYLTPQGLHDLIRNPKAVRSWPSQAMPALSDYLSDGEIDLIIAYLKHMAANKQAQKPVKAQRSSPGLAFACYRLAAGTVRSKTNPDEQFCRIGNFRDIGLPAFGRLHLCGDPYCRKGQRRRIAKSA